LLSWIGGAQSAFHGNPTEVLCPACGVAQLYENDSAAVCSCGFELQLTDECSSTHSLKELLGYAADAHWAGGCSRAPRFALRSGSVDAAQVLFLTCSHCDSCAVVL
jgi:hypothetical protein